MQFVLTFSAVIIAYYVIPLDRRGAGVQTVIRLLIAAALLLVILVWQVRQILRSELPVLRAVQGIALALPFFLCSYASTYVAMSDFSVDSFSEELSRTGALYFAIVTFGTVGFGDIAPLSDAARLVVSSQVLLDLVFIALVFRLFFAASRARLEGNPGRLAPVPTMTTEPHQEGGQESRASTS